MRIPCVWQDRSVTAFDFAEPPNIPLEAYVTRNETPPQRAQGEHLEAERVP